MFLCFKIKVLYSIIINYLNIHLIYYKVYILIDIMKL